MTSEATPGRRKALLELAVDLELARDAYLTAMESGNPDARAERREVLERFLWDDKGTIIDALRLAAKPAEDMREATIEECAKIAERAAMRCVREKIPGDSVATFCAQQIRSLSTTGSPNP
jgi:hypothetical protein